MLRKVSMRIALLLLIIVSGAANAATGNSLSKVIRVLQPGDGSFGGCMIEISKMPAGLNCPTTDTDPAGPSGWVTLDCEGKYGSKSYGNSKLNLAMAGLVMDQNVQVFVDDSRGDDGICYASQVRLASPSYN